MQRTKGHMKIKISQAVAFLVALGFAKAATWGQEKVQDRLSQVPEKVGTADVPEGFEDLYQSIVDSKGKVEVLAEEGTADAAAGEKSAKSKKGRSRPGPTTGARIETEKTKEAKPKKKPAPPAAEKDAYGCRVGTISAKVNKVLSKDWMTEEELAEAAGVTLDQARGRLYYAAEQGVCEHRRLVQYRLVPAKKS